MDNDKAALDQAQANYDRAFKHNPAGIGGSAEALALQQATNNYMVRSKANYDNAFQPASNGSLANAAANIDAAVAKLNALYPVTENGHPATDQGGPGAHRLPSGTVRTYRIRSSMRPTTAW